MSISTLTIYQDNKVGDSDLMPIHSPLVFLVDAEYTGGEPQFIYCKVYDKDSVLQGTFKCIPYQDTTATNRRFMFIADSLLKGFMEGYDDFAQSVGSFVYVSDITKVFTLIFSDPDLVASDVQTTITAIHGVSQFSETPNLPDIYNNVSETIIAPKDQPCYVYFYNDDVTNILSLSDDYEITFIVSDTGGFVSGAEITIGSDTETTDANGEATFLRGNGSYPYTIKKYGYADYSSTVVVSNANTNVNVTLTELTLETITFTLDKLGSTASLGVIIYYEGDIVANGSTGPGAANTVNLDLYVPYTYGVYGQASYCTGIQDYEQDNLITTLTNPFSIVPSVPRITVNVEFVVKDNVAAPINLAEITEDGALFFGCESGILYTNASGIATTAIYLDSLLLPGQSASLRHYYISKSGYSPVNDRVRVTTSDYNSGTGEYDVTINIVLN